MIDHNSPEGRCVYLLKEILERNEIPTDLEEEVRNAITAVEVDA